MRGLIYICRFDAALNHISSSRSFSIVYLLISRMAGKILNVTFTTTSYASLISPGNRLLVKVQLGRLRHKSCDIWKTEQIDLYHEWGNGNTSH